MKRGLLIRIFAMVGIVSAVVLFSIVLTDATEQLEANCAEGSMAWTETRLFMGRDIPKAAGGGEVSSVQWQAFTNTEIIPRFSTGFTVLDAAGFWQGEGCTVADLPGGCERSKMLLVQYVPSAEAEAAINAVATAYRTRFSQQSVMRSDHAVCTRFYAG